MVISIQQFYKEKQDVDASQPQCYTMQQEDCNHSVIEMPRKDIEDDDSNSSDWSEIANPGKSHLDQMIKRRNRFNLHYHKEAVVKIPQKNRIPLLPNQQNYDWIQERKLISIERSFPNSRQLLHRKRMFRYEQELDQQVPEIKRLQEEWNSLSQHQRQARTRKDSLLLLQSAKHIDVSGWCQAIDRYYIPQQQVRSGYERTKSQAGSVANFREDEDEEVSLDSTDKCFKEIDKLEQSDSNEFYFSDDSQAHISINQENNRQ